MKGRDEEHESLITHLVNQGVSGDEGEDEAMSAPQPLTRDPNIPGKSQVNMCDLFTFSE